MAKKLVIVESPAKAKTIRGYLGSDYEVEASVGHIRDLPANAKGLPESLRKKWWADYAVDIDNGFEPIYEVPAEKSQQVRRLREAMKGKDTLVLATDEDREGESISWHLLQVLKPAKSVTVQRIVFHEITRNAIIESLKHPREVDKELVEAQEARRILDRLYGYSLSPVLWSRVTKNLSAGRVQSPAVKLIVEREEQRRKFKTSAYWDLKARFESNGQSFEADLKRIDDRRVASGKDFDDETGQLAAAKTAVRLLNQMEAAALAKDAQIVQPWQVESLETKEATERPAPPFMTTTLAQDANRKFGFSADRTMRIAQQLYEGIELGGEQVGLISYMRTDSLTLSEDAIKGLRDLIRRDYADCLPDKPERYSSKVRNAQEAHEAIRPTDPMRRPADLERFLTSDQMKLYDLIWKRTVACQMKSARVLKTEVGIEQFVESDFDGADRKRRLLRFEASGKQILFDGFRRVYMVSQEVADEAEERKLPPLKKGQELCLALAQEVGHETKPPARYTDATLIKRLEERGIGRPSTYASILSTIEDRGYIRKSGRQIIPTFKAYLTMEVLERNFAEFMELDFTARMDDALDEIADGKADSRVYLKEFFIGTDGKPGLKGIVDARKREIPYPAFLVGHHPESGEAIVVRSGKDGGAFLQLGDAEKKRYANVPEDLAPADLTIERALELLERREAPAESAGAYLDTGRKLLVKNRQGYYLEVERTPEEIEAKVKPTWVSVPPGVDPRTLAQEDLDFLCHLPRLVGQHPEGKGEIYFKMGKYGAYLECGAERRTLEDWRRGEMITAEEAAAVLAQPKYQKAERKPMSALQEFGALDGCAGPVKVMSGRFGPYVTDGSTNATLPKGMDPVTVSADQAVELLAKKRAAGPSPRTRFVRRKGAGRKKK